MTLDDIKKYLQENKDTAEVREYIKGLITPEKVSEYLETEEGRKLIQPKIDANFTKGLETWKTNNLQKMLDEHANKVIEEKFPAESTEQKQLRELQQRFEKLEKEKTKEALKSKALTLATQKNLPIDVVDYFVGQDEESTISNISKFENVFNNSVKAIVENKFKEGGRKPQVDSTTTYTKNPFSRDTLNLSEQGKIVQENPEQAKILIKQAGKDPANYGL